MSESLSVGFHSTHSSGNNIHFVLWVKCYTPVQSQILGGILHMHAYTPHHLKSLTATMHANPSSNALYENIIWNSVRLLELIFLHCTFFLPFVNKAVFLRSTFQYIIDQLTLNSETCKAVFFLSAWLQVSILYLSL